MSDKQDTAERRALEKAGRALYAMLCESNGIDDNIWRLKDGTEIKADWPWASFNAARTLADNAYSEVKDVLGPEFNFFDEDDAG